MSGGEAKISVIMPVYNAGRYLRGAIDSVLAQTFRDFELILVDDGATDGSGAVCDEYAAKDARVRVKHGRNGGICASRNAGMDLAHGEWLAFCDHDDYMEPEFLELLYGVGKCSGVKVVKCDHLTLSRFADGAIRMEFPGMNFPAGSWRVADVLASGNYLTFRRLATLVWDALYLREFVEENGFRFDVSYKFGGEDIDFMLRVLAKSGGGGWVPRALYRHYVNIGTSMTARCHVELLDDCLRTAHMERRLFGITDARMRFDQFSEWTVGIIQYVFLAEGCQMSLREQALWMERYYNELVGREVCVPMRGLLPKRKFLNLCMRWRIVGFYLLMKRLVVCARHMTRPLPPPAQIN